ncbi:putative flippase GtrA [Streptomyces candidus]|uniref:Putative flippase GtrA n=2 Tax=Streptomyces candidus TaxID=67283 RepID=A0A7X0LPF0_9ACTN|nr:putative flippase GtrA [Streptomyces candidus]
MSSQILQVLRFALVGAVNTGTFYGFYLVLHQWLPYYPAYVVAFLLSMVGSFFLNTYFTYRTRPTWRKFLLFPLTNLTNFVVTSVGVFVLVEWCDMDERIAPLVAAAAAIPVTFVLSRRILTREDATAAGNGPAENGPAENGPAENGPAENGPAENGPAENGRTANGPGTTPGTATAGATRVTPATPARARAWQQRAGRLLSAERPVAALAGVVAMAAYSLGLALNGVYPFGPKSRAVNDLGNQFVPYHAHLRDLLHGEAQGDLLYNWNSGYGVPFLPDFFTYLTNPLSFLVALFPRDMVELPVFLVTLLCLGLAATAMTVFLARLRPGPAWQRGLLAVGYALCAWVISDGAADPMWMWGPIALPLIGIAADWCLHGRRWVLGTLLVALCWAANFYTAAMATLGAALVLVVRLLLRDDLSWRARTRVLLRAAGMAATSLLLVAPALTVSYLSSKASQPVTARPYKGPPDPVLYLAQIFPGGRTSMVAPGICFGLLGLVLVATYLFQKSAPVRERVLWWGLVLLVAVSFVLEPGVLLWHAFALPNGSPYRATFVLSGILTMVAWLALSRVPEPRELLRGAAVLAAAVLFTAGQKTVGTSTLVLSLGGIPVMWAGLWLLHRYGRPGLPGARTARALVAAGLGCAVLLSCAYTVFSVTAIKDRIPWYHPKRTYDAETLRTREALRAGDGLPWQRSDPGPHEYANNDPMLLGGQGGAYYSSHLPVETARTLQRLGAGWYIEGRHTKSFEEPVGLALMGSTTYVAANPVGTRNAEIRRAEAAPVVTVRPQGVRTDTSGAPVGADTADTADTAFDRLNSAIGAPVYQVPGLRAANGERPGPEGWPVRKGHRSVFEVRCSPGSTAYAHAPWFAGRVGVSGGPDRAWFGRGSTMTAAPVRELAQVPGNGRLTVSFVPTRKGQWIPERPVGCLDSGRLNSAISALRVSAPAQLTMSGHEIRATLRERTGGTAVVAAPAVKGWQCAVDGGAPRPAAAFQGLIAVPLGERASRFTCTYTQAGLTPGLLGSAAGLAVLAGVAVRSRTRGRRGGRDTGRTGTVVTDAAPGTESGVRAVARVG